MLGFSQRFVEFSGCRRRYVLHKGVKPRSLSIYSRFQILRLSRIRPEFDVSGKRLIHEWKISIR